MKKQLLLYIALTYLIFYLPYLNPTKAINGNDMQSVHYPDAHYLIENLTQLHFPFWTERLYAGFPIYADGQTAYLNPLRIITALVFGFVNCFKVEHFLIYFFGSVCLYKLLSKYNFSFTAFTASHLIYYFSFFHVIKMLHPNIIYITMLFPAQLYFLYLFFIEKKKQALVYSALVNAFGFYFGSINAVFYTLVPQGIYSLILLSENISRESFKRLIMFWLGFVFLFVTFTAPQLVPSIMLSSAGARGEQKDFNFTEGSWSPLLLVTTAYPFVFGDPLNYVGKLVSEWWTIHEVYYYAGITSMLLGIFGFFKLKNTPLKLFVAASLWTFVMLAFLKYSPLQNLLDIPPLNIFRYWGRMWFFVLFSLAICVGTFINNVNQKFQPRNLWVIAPPVLWMLFLEGKDGGIYLSQVLFKHAVLNGGIIRETHFLIWVLLGTAALVLVIMAQKASKFVPIIIFLDLLIFGRVILSASLINVDKLIESNLYNILARYENQRVIVYNDNYVGNRPLYYKNWNIFGYAGPYEDVMYAKYLLENGFESSRRIKQASVSAQAAENLNITAVVNSDMSIRELSQKSAYEQGQKEGRYAIKTNFQEPTTIATKIRNYNGWQIWLDGKKFQATSSPDDLFVKYIVPAGQHTVELKYFPVEFYLGLAIFAAGLAIWGAGLFINKSFKRVV